MSVPSRFVLPVLLIWMFVSVAGCSEDSSTVSSVEAYGFGVCPEDDYLQHRIAASSWAEGRAGIAEYEYRADVRYGYAEIDLLDEEGRKLGGMEVRQLFNDPFERDGTMQAVLQEDAPVSPLRVLSRGEDVDHRGYTVRMRIERIDEMASLHLEARFKTVGCWIEQEEAVAPPCAGGLPLDAVPFTLPSCGLIVDERVRQHLPPRLERLTYSVEAHQIDNEPTLGGAHRAGLQEFFHLDVYGAQGARDEAEVAQWLSETGLADLIGTDEERLLTTAFLDQTWLRTLELHTAYCEVQKLPRPESESDPSIDDEEGEDIQTETMNLCPGDQDNESWSESISRWVSDLWGDPHLTTWDGYAYDLQAAGEFVLAEAHAGEPFVVQGRFEPLGESNIEGCGDLSWNTAAATEIGGRRVSVRSHPQWEVRVDGELVEGPGDVPELSGDSTIEVEQGRVTLKWESGESAQFIERPSSRGHASLTVELAVPDHRRGQLRGLLGQLDGESRTDLVLPDGTSLTQPASFEDLYEVLAPAWRVYNHDSLFDYASGEDADSFVIDGFPASPTQVADLSPDRVREAEQVCIDEGVSDAHVLSACILDVVCFDDSTMARAAADAGEPVASQPPGRHDLVVERAVRHVSAPEVVEAQMEVPKCNAPAEPTIALFDEQLSTSVGQTVNVDISEPGRYEVGGAFSATSISSGTEVSSYQLVRRIPHNPDHLVAGAVRFAQPIVGVIVDEEALAATDALLGASNTTYDPAGLKGLSSERDFIAISDDRRRLDLVWSGVEAHRIRVLVEAP